MLGKIAALVMIVLLLLEALHVPLGIRAETREQDDDPCWEWVKENAPEENPAEEANEREL